MNSLLQDFKNNTQALHYAKRVKSIVLNFGPQHPASHGVLRLVLQLSGEIVEKVDPHIGFLHRGSEKLMEFCTISQAAFFLDRLDYTSVITQSHAFCLTIEKLNSFFILDISDASARTIFDELGRLLNHLLAVSTHALDVGTMSTLFWAFEDREQIMELCEYITGTRMHLSLHEPFVGFSNVLNIDFFIKLLNFLKNSLKTYTEIYISLFNNRVWKLRLVSIGILSAVDAMLAGCTGPILRSTGVLSDLRLNSISSYASYWFLSFYSYLGVNGDCYDRFLIRSRELFESISIIYQAVTIFKPIFNSFDINLNFFYNDVNKTATNLLTNIEQMVFNFKKTENFFNNCGYLQYGAVEAGKGEFGVTILINQFNKISRVHLRSPAYNHLQLLARLGQGHFLADIVTLIGTLDVVFGEVDR